MVTLPITLSDPYTAPNHPILYICTTCHMFLISVVGNFKFGILIV